MYSIQKLLARSRFLVKGVAFQSDEILMQNARKNILWTRVSSKNESQNPQGVRKLSKECSKSGDSHSEKEAVDIDKGVLQVQFNFLTYTNSEGDLEMQLDSEKR